MNSDTYHSDPYRSDRDAWKARAEHAELLLNKQHKSHALIKSWCWLATVIALVWMWTHFIRGFLQSGPSTSDALIGYQHMPIGDNGQILKWMQAEEDPKAVYVSFNDNPAHKCALTISGGAGGACDCADLISGGNGGQATLVARGRALDAPGGQCGVFHAFDASDAIPQGGAISFVAVEAGIDVLRIEADGRVFVYGRLAAFDNDVYEAFRQWLAASGHYSSRSFR